MATDSDNIASNGYDSSSTYFGAASPEDCAHTLLQKATDWFRLLNTNGYLEKLRDCYAAFHGAYYSDLDSGHTISFGGEEGELVNLAVNHWRNLADHIVTMVTSNRPVMQAQAVNTDYRSLVQSKLATGLLEYYMREKRLEEKLKVAVEYAVVLAAGFIKMEWNPTSGEIYDNDPETGAPIYEGDLEFTNLSPFDVVVDSFKESPSTDWILTRTFKNRFAIAAKYPEYKDKIVALYTKSELYRFRFISSIPFEQTDDIPVYEFFHKKDEAVPEGRYMMFLDYNLVLEDSPLLYPHIPVYRIAPANILGTPYGYTPMFDILPIQDGINALYSTIMTNQNAFGVQNVIVDRGSDIEFSALQGGLNIISGNFNGGANKPEALNLTHTPEEVFKFLQMLEQAAETLSGVNSVARGNPEASLKSGSALALVQSMALQFLSGLKRQNVRLIEDLGMGIIATLKVFAAVPRVRAIAGKYNSTLMKEFTSDDLSEISRISVEVGNPLAQTTAGRVQMATELIQYGIIKTPEEYFQVLTTGNLDVLTEGQENSLLNIKLENENLISGQEVMAIFTDQHRTHILKHAEVLGNPDLRFNPELVNAVQAHIQEHIMLLRTTDPALLTLLGEQPLPPPGSPPPTALPPGAGANNSQQPALPPAPPQGAGPSQQGGNAVQLPTGQKIEVPQPAKPPPLPKPPTA